MASKETIPRDKLTDEHFQALVVETSRIVCEWSGWDAVEESNKLCNLNLASNSRLVQPKRPMNAFMVWSQAIRRKLHQRFSNVQNALLSKALGKVWRTIDQVLKEPFVKRANSIKAQHKLQYPNYRYQPRRLQQARNGARHQEPGARVGSSSTVMQKIARQSKHANEWPFSQSSEQVTPSYGNNYVSCEPSQHCFYKQPAQYQPENISWLHTPPAYENQCRVQFDQSYVQEQSSAPGLQQHSGHLTHQSNQQAYGYQEVQCELVPIQSKSAVSHQYHGNCSSHDSLWPSSVVSTTAASTFNPDTPNYRPSPVHQINNSQLDRFYQPAGRVQSNLSTGQYSEISLQIVDKIV